MKKYNYGSILEVWKEPRIDYVESARVNKRRRILKLMRISIGLILALGIVSKIYQTF